MFYVVVFNMYATGVRLIDWKDIADIKIFTSYSKAFKYAYDICKKMPIIRKMYEEDRSHEDEWSTFEKWCDEGFAPNVDFPLTIYSCEVEP